MDLNRRVIQLEVNMGGMMEDVYRIKKDVKHLREQFDNLNETVQFIMKNLEPKLDALKEIEERFSRIRPSSPSAPIRCTNYESYGSVLISDGTSVASSNTESILMAAESGNDASLRVLLQSGASLSERTPNGDTPLHLAAASGHADTVGILLKAGAPVDTIGCRLQTPLHRAAERDHVGSVLCLLNAGAKTNVRDIDGCTPLIRAVQNEARNVVEILVQSGVSLDDGDREGNSAMVHAARAKDWETVRRLCKNGASVNRFRGRENSPLLLAISDGASDITKLLLRRTVMSSDDVKEALLHTKDESIALVFEEIFPGIFKTDEAGSALVEAAAQGRLSTLRTLLDVGVYVNAHDTQLYTALMRASSYGHAECVETLLQRSANKNMQNREGSTALHLASSRGHANCVQMLLKAGALTELLDYRGRTALDLATSSAVLNLF